MRLAIQSPKPGGGVTWGAQACTRSATACAALAATRIAPGCAWPSSNQNALKTLLLRYFSSLSTRFCIPDTMASRMRFSELSSARSRMPFL